ncbi:MAG TPA: AAA family ATPase, partial [Roseiflexaceae bacterium]|nr:AAA family ATPase [Roseiflexaceae bacterium]
GQPIWSPETVAKLHRAFVERVDESSRSFDEKFKDQLAEADPATVLLAGELLYVHLLPANGTKPETKRAQIRRVLDWASAPITTSIPPELDKALDGGVAQASQAFRLGKPYQMGFLLTFVLRWKELPAPQRELALADPWEFKRFVFSLPIYFALAQRELLLHMVYPDTFEATMARDHKQQIAEGFAYLIDSTIPDVDQRLAQIRARLEPAFGPGFSFYDQRLKQRWQPPLSDNVGDDPATIAAPEAPPHNGTDQDALDAWQAAFQSDNPISRMIAADYPQWLSAHFGKRVVIQPEQERELYVYIDGVLHQYLSLNRVMGVYVLLYDAVPWDTSALPTMLTRPNSFKRREPYGSRFFVTNEPDYQLLKQLMQVMTDTGGRPSPLPRTLGDRLQPYVELAAQLDGSAYSAAQIVELLGRLSPPIAKLSRPPDPEALADDLLRLRLLEPLPEGGYRRWEHLADATVAHMRRYAALTLLVREEDDYWLPVLEAPFDGLPHPPEVWPLGADLLAWYEEAGLARRNNDGTWQSLPDALEPLDAPTPTARALNTFLEHLRRARANQGGLPPLEDRPLRALKPEVLEQRIAEIQRELLIERDTILRIYRSLIAGQHVILSGPPGTGKTHLARILPGILWRDEQDTVVLRMPATPELPPTTPPDDVDPLRREGYTVEVVTATEDWGVRHVIGGIAPQLVQGESGTALVYRIRHGHLTRAVLANYEGYDGERIPPLAGMRRREPADAQGRRYRGHWLIIDEFTRAQVDAAFGSLLTTLGGQRAPTLAVPTDDGNEQHVPLPQDFRLIGTLNSFDRHFLNQISEAMKRRFAFIDILPPGRAAAAQEQAQAIFRALRRLYDYGLADAHADANGGTAHLPRVLEVRREEDADGQRRVRYRLDVQDPEARAALDSFWRLFTAIRLYRQLGTAQAEAAYAALLTGYSIGMGWAAALDAALADTLADQLQVLARDEQRALLAAIEHADAPQELRERLEKILGQLPIPRQSAHLAQLKAAEGPDAPPINDMDPASLSVEQVRYLFGVDPQRVLPAQGLFANRLRAFVNERGL